LGGNLVQKLVGEYGDNPPKEVLAVCAVSPSIDLSASADLIMKRSNWIYQKDFVRRLKKRVRTNHKLHPDLYDLSDLVGARTIKDFDDRFTARAHGFANADDYYYRSSSLRVVGKIRIPTLIIHAEDDPFIPFSPMRDPAVANNPYILLIAPAQGGHVAFISDKSPRQKTAESVQNSTPSLSETNSELRTQNSALLEDRFWAENRVVEFCKLARSEFAG
jgi:predicted alpha/beta-fold hydrolase